MFKNHYDLTTPFIWQQRDITVEKPRYFKPREQHGGTLELEGAQLICNIDIRVPGSLLRFLSNGWETLSLHHNASGFVFILSASIHSQFSLLLLLLFLTKLGVV